MFIPEYTITPKTLNNISQIEYSRGVIESSDALPRFLLKLEKEMLTDKVFNTLLFSQKPFELEVIKRHVSQLNNVEIPPVDNLINAYNEIKIISQSARFEEEEVKKIYQLLNKSTDINYRTIKKEGLVSPEEILAETTQLFDWYNSIDAKNTNQILVAGILKGQLETIVPFDKNNFEFANFISYTALLLGGYTLANLISIENHYYKYKNLYFEKLDSIKNQDYDFTEWLEFYTDALARQALQAEQQITVVEKESKLAKVSGRVHLTKRQEKIIEYITDYGFLQNKEFSTLFPNLSEDSVLRDLKKLIKSGLIQRIGSTKSSRYVLK